MKLECCNYKKLVGTEHIQCSQCTTMLLGYVRLSAYLLLMACELWMVWKAQEEENTSDFHRRPGPSLSSEGDAV